jgi:6-phosphogluconolactonase
VTLVVAKDAAELARKAADVLLDLLGRGASSVALPGGRTPKAVYELLAADPRVPWDRVDWYFGDERAVPADHPDSNYRLAKETLFRGRPAERLHRMAADAADAEAAAREYERGLPDPIDVVLLGMGEDGHVASLFPGAPALAVRDRRVAVVDGSPKPPPRRMTITPPAIESARSIVVLVAGAEKSAMLARALEGPLDAKSVPAVLARRGAWIVDAAAAGRLA